MIFDYPEQRPERRHGPDGYTAYESYRPWLRDEFTFRCIYCLKRETWGQVTCEFELDHFEPQSIAPSRKLDYFNLVYACRRCNSVKLNQPIANPLELLAAPSVTVFPDGELVASHSESRRLIRQLDLNSPALIRWRVIWLRIVDLARDRDPSLYRQPLPKPRTVGRASTMSPRDPKSAASNEWDSDGHGAPPESQPSRQRCEK